MALLSNFNQISTSSGTPINMIQGSDSPIGWTGTNAVVATETSSALIPYHPLKTTAIRINSTSANGYGSTTFTVPAGVPATLMGISFGFESNDTSTWLVQLWQGATQQTLSVGFINGTTTPVTFNTTAVLTGGLTYELRIISVLNNKTCYINNVTASLNLATPANVVGAAIGEWQTVMMTTTNVTSTVAAKMRRVGSSAEFSVIVTATGNASGTVYLNMPSGMTISSADLSSGFNTFGTGYVFDSSSGATYYNVTALGVNNSTQIQFTCNGESLVNATDPGPDGFDSGDILHTRFTVPIAEWAGSGTVNLGPGAQVEYAYNSSLTATTDTTSFAYGPQGAAFQNYSPGVMGTVQKRVRFQYPIQTDDIIVMEIQNGTGNPWVLASDYGINFVSYGTAGTPGTPSHFYGYLIDRVAGSTTDVNVNFYGSGAYLGSAWSNFSGLNWRLRKAKASSPVGFGRATSSEAGLMLRGRFQTKILVGNEIMSSSETNFSGLTFNNLTIGKTYRVTGQLWCEIITTAQPLNIFFRDGNGGTIVSQVQVAGAAGTVVVTGVSFIFTPTSTTLQSSKSGAGSSSATLAGNNTRARTYLQIEELDITETTAWT